VSNASYAGAKKRERSHFLRCPLCGEWVDKRDLDEVLKHSTDHGEAPDVPYKRSLRVMRGSATQPDLAL